MDKGLVHIYCGDGKGKTTAGRARMNPAQASFFGAGAAMNRVQASFFGAGAAKGEN